MKWRYLGELTPHYRDPWEAAPASIVSAEGWEPAGYAAISALDLPKENRQDSYGDDARKMRWCTRSCSGRLRGSMSCALLVRKVVTGKSEFELSAQNLCGR